MNRYKKTDVYVTKVLNSQTFSKSTVSRELLKYLAENSLKGEVISEYQIASDIFGGVSKNGKDKNIRIYVHNLRKKLADYYEREGIDDDVVVSIPKGGYQMAFEIDRPNIIKQEIYRLSPYTLIISILILTLSIIFGGRSSSTKEAKGFIWRDFIESDYSTMIVLGNHYFFNAKNHFGGGYGMMRLTGVNSDADFDTLLSRYPGLDDKLKPSDQTYINLQAPYGLFKVMTLLGGGGTEVDMSYSSRLNWEQVKGKNFIFIGSYKTQNILKQTHQSLGLSYNINRAILQVESRDSVEIFRSKSGDFLLEEHATLVKFTTEDNRNYISIMCNSDIGNIALVNYLSSIDNLRDLEEAVDKLELSNFKAVFNVKGHKSVDFEIELVSLTGIENDIETIWP